MPKKFDLTITDIYSILEACKKNGVISLKFGGLEVKFGRTSNKIQNNIPDTVISEEQRISVEKKAVEEDEAKLKEEELATLLIEDPMEYERLIRAGELENNEKA